VLVHTGFAINVMDEQEAHETLKLLAELAAFDPEAAPDASDEHEVH
jgi:hydrogenase maturation factor